MQGPSLSLSHEESSPPNDPSEERLEEEVGRRPPLVAKVLVTGRWSPVFPGEPEGFLECLAKTGFQGLFLPDQEDIPAAEVFGQMTRWLEEVAYLVVLRGTHEETYQESLLEIGIAFALGKSILFVDPFPGDPVANHPIFSHLHGRSMVALGSIRILNSLDHVLDLLALYRGRMR